MSIIIKTYHHLLSATTFWQLYRRKVKKRLAASIKLACSTGVCWAGESCLFMFVLLKKKTKWRLGRLEIATLRVGARAKEGNGRGGGERKISQSILDS